MGVDVWVRRPGGPLAGVGPWDARPLAPAEAADGEQVARVMSEVAERSPTPLPAPTAPAPFEPATRDVAARWDALRTEVLTCTKCVLHQSRTQGVLGVGPRRSDWMV